MTVGIVAKRSEEDLGSAVVSEVGFITSLCRYTGALTLGERGKATSISAGMTSVGSCCDKAVVKQSVASGARSAISIRSRSANGASDLVRSNTPTTD
jgi:hypothetical protein